MKYIIFFLTMNITFVYAQTTWIKIIYEASNSLVGNPYKNMYENSNGHYNIMGYQIDTLGNIVTKTNIPLISKSMIQTIDGGYAFTGYVWTSISPNSTKICLFKTNAQGDSLWTKYYGGENLDIGYDIKQTTDGGYIIVGYSESFYTNEVGGNQQQFGMYLIRTDEYGDTLWTKVHEYNPSGPIEQALSVTINPINNSYIIGGHSGSEYFNFNSSYFDNTQVYMYYSNFNDNGELLWENTIDYSEVFSTSILFDVKSSHDGHFILTGTHTSSSDDIWSDAILLKINEEGETIQSNTYAFAPELEVTGYTHLEYAWETQITNDGGYIVVGKYGNFPTLWKVDENLEMQWYKQFSFKEDEEWGTINNQIRSVLPTSDGGYLLLGKNTQQLFLIKTDSLGNCEPTASYDFAITDSLNLLLTSSSIAANAIAWHFGDGDTLVIDTLQEQSIAHQYEEAGIYEVCLVAQNLCANDTLCQNINIGNVSSADFWKKSDLSIYPNPTKNEVYITAEFPKKVSQYNIRIYDATSCLLKEENNLSLHSQTLQTHFSLESYAKGIYFVEIWADEFSVWEKIVKF